MSAASMLTGPAAVRRSPQAVARPFAAGHEVAGLQGQAGVEPAGERSLGLECRLARRQLAERQHRQTVEAEQHLSVRVLRAERNFEGASPKDCAPLARDGERHVAAARLALGGDAERALAIAGRLGASNQVERSVGEQARVGSGARRDLPDERIVRKALGQDAHQLRQVDGDHRCIDPAGRRRREAAQRAGGADRGALHAADRQPVDLQRAFAQPERRVDRLGGQAGGRDGAGLDVEVEIVVGQPVDARIADEERSEGAGTLDIEGATGKLDQHRRLGVRRLPAIDLALELGAAQDQLERAEALPLRRQGDLGLEAGTRQPPHRLVDVARKPSREAGRLGHGKQKVAVEGQAARRPQLARPLERGAARQGGRKRLHRPAVDRRVGRDADIPDGRVASHDRRQGDLDAAGNRGARQRRQGGLDRGEAAGERQAGALADGLGIVDADLGALCLDLEARLAAEIDQGAAVRRVGVGDGTRLEAELLDRQALMVEREAAVQPVRARALGRRRLGRCAVGRLGVLGGSEVLRLAQSQVEAAGKAQRAALKPGLAIRFQHQGLGRRLGADTKPHGAVLVDLAGRDAEHGRRAVDRGGAVGAPGSGEGAGGNFGLDRLDLVNASRGGMDQRHLAFGHGEPFERDLPRIEGRRWADRPVDRAVGTHVDGDARPIQAHVEDQHLAAHERRELGIHGEGLHGHRRLVRVVAGDDHLGEAQRRERQDAGRDVALDGHPTAKHGGRLTFEIGPVGRPVDEMRPDQRRRQRQHEKPTYDHEQSRQRLISTKR